MPAAFLGWRYLQNLPAFRKQFGQRKRKAAPKIVKPEGPEDKSEWLKGTHYDRAEKAKIKRANSRQGLAKPAVS